MVCLCCEWFVALVCTLPRKLCVVCCLCVIVCVLVVVFVIVCDDACLFCVFCVFCVCWCMWRVLKCVFVRSVCDVLCNTVWLG